MDQNNLRFITGNECSSVRDINNSFNTFIESNILKDSYRGSESMLINYIDTEYFKAFTNDPVGFIAKKSEDFIVTTLVPPVGIFNKVETFAEYVYVENFYANKDQAQAIVKENLSQQQKDAGFEQIGKTPTLNTDGTVTWEGF